ncbi:hypothetical protein ACFLXE_05520 [Chloroflexota bacterium]
MKQLSVLLFALILLLPAAAASCGGGNGLVNLTHDSHTQDMWPSWSPDGGRIVFLSGTVDISGDPPFMTMIDSGIYIMDADGSNRTLAISPPIGIRSPSWSPDGRRIVFAVDYRGGISTVGIDGTNPIPVVSQMGQYNITDWPSYSPDGSKIMFAADLGEGWQLFVVESDGGNESCLSPPDVDDMSPAWSPDGTRIAFDSKRAGLPEIYVMNADGGNPVRLTENMFKDLAPTWSPDGSRIAFVSTRDGKADIYIMRSDGSNVTRLTDNDIAEIDPEWSPDGRKIVFCGYREDGGQPDIYTVDVPADM